MTTQTDHAPLTVWLVAACIADPAARCYMAPLFRSWLTWCMARGQAPGTRLEFGNALRKTGCEPFVDSYARGVTGIRLRCGSDAPSQLAVEAVS